MGILRKKISSIALAFTMIIGISTGLIFNMPMTTQASNAPSVYNSGDSFIGTDGNEMSASKAKQWSYEISYDGKSIRLERYKGTFPGGQINGFVPKMINGLPVTTMEYTFYQCDGLVVGPDIPDTVTLMHYTFLFCTSLVEALIPSNVTNLNYTFGYCSNLVTAPVIPSSVTKMDNTFACCQRLAKAPIIPSGVTHMDATFAFCKSLTEKPEIPSSVKYLMLTFWGCDNIK